MSRRKIEDYGKQELRELVDEACTPGEVLKAMRYDRSGNTYQRLRTHAERIGVVLPGTKGKKIVKKKSKKSVGRLPMPKDSEFLRKDSTSVLPTKTGKSSLTVKIDGEEVGYDREHTYVYQETMDKLFEEIREMEEEIAKREAAIESLRWLG